MYLPFLTAIMGKLIIPHTHVHSFCHSTVSLLNHGKYKHFLQWNWPYLQSLPQSHTLRLHLSLSLQRNSPSTIRNDCHIKLTKVESCILNALKSRLKVTDREHQWNLCKFHTLTGLYPSSKAWSIDSITLCQPKKFNIEKY